MSLFKTKEWWSYDSGAGPEELYSSNSLAIHPFKHLTGTNSNLIVTGSLTGIVRIFNPALSNKVKNKETDETKNNLQVNTSASSSVDLLLEANLKSPILEIEVGQLSSNGETHLAILHPRLLSVYTIQKGSNSNEPSTSSFKSTEASTSSSNKNGLLDSYQIVLLYQHKLARAAFSLTIGHFGGVINKDFMCVQSIDGAISVFEQESYTFSRFLPNFLLPNPIVYVERTDSLITLSSSYEVQSFGYRSLAVKSERDQVDAGGDVNSKRIVATWVVGLGEEASHIQVVPPITKDVPSGIIVLGRRTLYMLQDTGVLTFSRKLDFCATALRAFRPMLGQEKIASLISTDDQSMFVMDNSTMRWATQLPFSPLVIKRGSFVVDGSENDGSHNAINHHNLIVLLSKSGDIFAGFLGTDPTLHTATVANVRSVNYQDTDKELARLNATIKEYLSKGETSDITTTAMKDELSVIVAVENQLERCIHSTQFQSPEADTIPMAKIRITLRTNVPLVKIKLSIEVQPPLVVTQPSHIVNSLSDEYSFSVYCYLYNMFVPQSLELTVVSVYLTSQGAPNIVTSITNLPMKLLLKPCTPIKDADYKVTICTNKPAVSLIDLYPEFVLESTMANAAGFQHFCGHFVTILSSKNSQRYRIQSDNLPSLWLLIQSLENRLHSLFDHLNSNTKNDSNQNSSPLEFSYSASLPLHEYFTEIETHFHKRNKLNNLMEQLAQRTSQLRSIERRLLTRFKDKTPTPLTNLDTLMEGTYRHVLETTGLIEECQMECARSSNNLSCITSILVFLMHLTASMTFEEISLVQSALSPIVNTSQEQGWEDTTDAALTFLLRTSLAKPGKENQGATPISLKSAKDTTRLRKHISSVIDRINKGGRISDSKNPIEATELLEFGGTSDESLFDGEFLSSNDKKSVESNHEQEGDENSGPTNEISFTPAGSQFGEIGERIRSAKAGSRMKSKQMLSDNSMNMPMNSDV